MTTCYCYALINTGCYSRCGIYSLMFLLDRMYIVYTRVVQELRSKCYTFFHTHCHLLLKISTLGNVCVLHIGCFTFAPSVNIFWVCRGFSEKFLDNGNFSGVLLRWISRVRALCLRETFVYTLQMKWVDHWRKSWRYLLPFLYRDKNVNKENHLEIILICTVLRVN